MVFILLLTLKILLRALSSCKDLGCFQYYFQKCLSYRPILREIRATRAYKQHEIYLLQEIALCFLANLNILFESRLYQKTAFEMLSISFPHLSVLTIAKCFCLHKQIVFKLITCFPSGFIPARLRSGAPT